MSAHTETVADWAERVGGMLAGSPRPELAEGRLSVLGAGMDSLAVLVEAGDGRWVVRLPKGEDAVEGIAREARLLPELAGRVRLPIPRFAFTAANPLGPGECCVYPAVPGESLSDDEWVARGLLGSDAVARAVAEFLDSVHGFPVRRAVELGVEEVDFRKDFAADLELVRAQVIPLLPEREGRRLAEIWEEYLAEDANFEYEPALIHADVSLDHLLVTGESISGVIDFGDVQVGDPDYDLCYLWSDAGAVFVERVRAAQGLGFDARLRAKLDFWACADHAVDVLHAIEHEMTEFREIAIAGVCEAVTRFGGQASGSL